MFDLFFEDAGSKIKVSAKVLFAIGAACAILVGLAMLLIGLLTLSGGGIFQILLAPVVTAINLLYVWLPCCMLYAFGEIANKICDNEYNTQRIASLFAKKNKEMTNANVVKTQTAAKVAEEKKPKGTTQVVLHEPRQSEVQPQEELEEGAFVSGKTYHNGDMVKFEGGEYVCVCESSSGTVWSPKQNPRLWKKV